MVGSRVVVPCRACSRARVRTPSAPSDALPLRDDLRTRLAQGLVFRLEALDDAGMRHALAAEARRRGLPLSGEVSHYLLTRFARDFSMM